MATKNENLIDDAEKAITDLFNDKSVGRPETADTLSELIGFIQDMIDTLDDNNNM